MEKEFVPYELALELKELGFDEPCFGWFTIEGDGAKPKFILSTKYKQDIGLCLAPLYQQAFRWFRENYGLRIRNYVFVNMSGGISEGFEVFRYAKDTISRVWALTYEEAELACLKKLIEIVKNK